MRAFTVHLPPGTAAGAVPPVPPPAHAPRLLREGFSWGALLLGPLWLLAHRCWLAALGAVLVLVAAGFAPAPLDLALGLGLHALLGWHGQDLRRWTLARRGWTLAHVVLGQDEEAALLRLLAAEPRLRPLYAGARR